MELIKNISNTLIPQKDRKPDLIETHSMIEDLKKQKEIIESKISKIEKRDLKEKVHQSLLKFQEINDSLVDLQNSLNLIWKRTKQAEADLIDALNSN